jgi:hypothetical protein
LYCVIKKRWAGCELNDVALSFVSYLFCVHDVYRTDEDDVLYIVEPQDMGNQITEAGINAYTVQYRC